MDMKPAVSYIPYATSSRGETRDIITSAHFEEGHLLSKTCDGTERNNKYDGDSTLPPLTSEE